VTHASRCNIAHHFRVERQAFNDALRQIDLQTFNDEVSLRGVLPMRGPQSPAARNAPARSMFDGRGYAHLYAREDHSQHGSESDGPGSSRVEPHCCRTGVPSSSWWNLRPEPSSCSRTDWSPTPTSGANLTYLRTESDPK
jgi:hypothetical protein